MSDSVSTIPPPQPDSACLRRALASLAGLSVVDALGERLFVNPASVEQLIHGETCATAGGIRNSDDVAEAPPEWLERRGPLSGMSSSALEGLS